MKVLAIVLCCALGAAGVLGSPRKLMQGDQVQAVQQLPQFLLPPVPPQAAAQVEALLTSINGNVNAFANALVTANNTGGTTAVAKAFADTISQGNASALLSAIATATAFGRADISNITDDAYARAVADQIGRGNVQQASDAIAGAFTLVGGAGPALATVTQLNSIVQSVGCTGPMADSLRQATQLLGSSGSGGSNNTAPGSGGPGNCTIYGGRGQTFAYSVAQSPGVSGCWTTVGGDVAGGLLSSIQPVLVVIGSNGTTAIPSGTANPTATELPPSGESGANTPAATAPAGATNVAAPGLQTPVASGSSSSNNQDIGSGSALVPNGAGVAPASGPTSSVPASDVSSSSVTG
jgi:hypothetical protein